MDGGAKVDTQSDSVRLKRFAIQYSTRLFVIEYYRGDKIYRKNVRIKKKSVDIKDIGRLVDKIISLNKNILGSHIANREQIQDLITLLVTCADTETSVIEDGDEGKKDVTSVGTTLPVTSSSSQSTVLRKVESTADNGVKSLGGLLFGAVEEGGDEENYAEKYAANTETDTGTGTVMFGPNSGNNDYSYDMKEDEVEIPDDLNKASDDVLTVAKAKMDVKFEENRLRPGDEGFEWDKQIDFDPPQEASEWDD